MACFGICPKTFRTHVMRQQDNTYCLKCFSTDQRGKCHEIEVNHSKSELPPFNKKSCNMHLHAIELRNTTAIEGMLYHVILQRIKCNNNHSKFGNEWIRKRTGIFLCHMTDVIHRIRTLKWERAFKCHSKK